jgi:hypothetical protein
MRTLKRLGTGLLATGVAAVGMLMTAPLASAHTGTLVTSAVCNDDGTRLITYTGSTTSVPNSGPGHTATLQIGEIQPAGTTVDGAPNHVVGNTTYTFTQTVPGAATYAQATAFLVWGDGAKSDPIGKINLSNNCSHDVAPSGSYSTACSATGANVVIGTLDSGTWDHVVWTLTYGGAHKVVTSGETVAVPSHAWVDLSYSVNGGHRHSVQHGKAPYKCPPEVPASGSYTTECTATGANVVIGTLESGTNEDVVWTLTVGGAPQVVTSGETVAVASNAALDLSYQAGTHPSQSVQHGNAPDACPPEVPASGSFTVVCSDTGANVTIGTLTSGTKPDVVWTLTYGSSSKTVSTGDVVAVPSRAALTLSFTAGDDTSGTVQTGTAPASCADTNVLGEHHSHSPSGNQPTEVLGVSLAHTGAPAQLPWTLGFAGLFLMAGSAMIFLARRPEGARVPRNDQN